MSSAITKHERNKARSGPKPRRTTPDSATSQEKERLDDEAVEHAVTVTENPANLHSILPAPQVPPNEQESLREGKVSEQIKGERKPSRTAQKKS